MAEPISVLDQDIRGVDALDIPRRDKRKLALAVWRSLWPKLAAVALVFAVWELVVVSGWKPTYVLPPPYVVFGRLGELITTATFWTAVGITLQRAAFGFALAVSLGTILGLAVSQSSILRRAALPLLTPFLLIDSTRESGVGSETSRLLLLGLLLRLLRPGGVVVPLNPRTLALRQLRIRGQLLLRADSPRQGPNHFVLEGGHLPAFAKGGFLSARLCRSRTVIQSIISTTDIPVCPGGRVSVPVRRSEQCSPVFNPPTSHSTLINQFLFVPLCLCG